MNQATPEVDSASEGSKPKAGPLGVPETVVHQDRQGRLVDVHWSALTDEEKREVMESAPVVSFDEKMRTHHGEGTLNWSKDFALFWHDVYVGYDNNNDIDVIAATTDVRGRSSPTDLRLSDIEGYQGAGGRALEFLKRMASDGGRTLTVPEYQAAAIKFYLDHGLKVARNGVLFVNPGDTAGNPITVRREFSEVKNRAAGSSVSLSLEYILAWAAESFPEHSSPRALREALTQKVKRELGEEVLVQHLDRLTRMPISDGAMSASEFVDDYLEFHPA